MKRSRAVTIVWLACVQLWLACAPSPQPAASDPTEPHSPSTAGAPPSPSAAGDPTSTPAGDPRTPPAPGAPARPAPVKERNIYIDAVEMANPLVVRGRSRTFENHVTLRARDAKGNVIAETFTTATGEIGHHNPFRGTIWLTRHPGASITVEALEYSARDGSEQSLVSVTRPFAVDAVDVRLFLPNRDCTGVVAHARRVPKSISMARLLVEMLLAEPAPFPKDARVESVNLRSGTLTVGFNERLQNVGGACAAQMIRDSVTRTLLTLPSVKKVVITAGGSESLALQP